MKNDFPKKSELPEFILLVKISWLNFFCSFQGGNEEFAEITEGSLSRLAALPLNFTLTAMPLDFVLEIMHARVAM